MGMGNPGLKCPFPANSPLSHRALISRAVREPWHRNIQLAAYYPMADPQP